jgi:ppGpp synthetase/RelA/SpoT-type nucleotidyltranferase
MEALSKNQIDKLGQRLKPGNLSDSDLEMLDEYGESFSDAYREVSHAIRTQLNLEPSERIRKTNKSIIAKLQRGNTQLSRMQDIVGCRLVVPDIKEQNRILCLLQNFFHPMC